MRTSLFAMRIKVTGCISGKLAKPWTFNIVDHHYGWNEPGGILIAKWIKNSSICHSAINLSMIIIVWKWYCHFTLVNEMKMGSLWQNELTDLRNMKYKITFEFCFEICCRQIGEISQMQPTLSSNNSSCEINPIWNSRTFLSKSCKNG